jgi:hypothetical protein
MPGRAQPSTTTRPRQRVLALGAVTYSLVQVLGGVWPGRPVPADEGIVLFHAVVWVVSMHEFLGTASQPRARRGPHSRLGQNGRVSTAR